MGDPSCIFCRIVAGEIPSLKVFEDEACFAFLDIGPLAEGHVLLIPRDHHVGLGDMPPETMAALARVLPRLVGAVMKATSAAGCNVLQNTGRVAGQEVMHVHFHIIPRKAGDGLGYRWNSSKYAEGRGEQVRRSVLDALQS